MTTMAIPQEQQVALARPARLGAPTQLSKTARQAIPAFLQKLYEMINDPKNEELIRWSDAGDSFFVLDHERFAHEVLGRWFKHRNFASFVRQLNMYGFHKIPHLQQGVLKSDSDVEYWNFAHVNFHKDQPDLLCLIQRKKQAAQAGEDVLVGMDLRADGSGGGGPAAIGPPHQHQINAAPLTTTTGGGTNASGGAASLTSNQLLDIQSIVNGVAALKRHQTTISAELNELKRSNQLLWQDAMDARAKHQKQQDTINRIVKFLAGVFGQHGHAGGHGQQGGAGGEAGGGVGGEAVEEGEGVRVRTRLMIEDARRDAGKHHQHQHQQPLSATVSTPATTVGGDGDDHTMDEDEEEQMYNTIIRSPTISSSYPQVETPASPAPSVALSEASTNNITITETMGSSNTTNTNNNNNHNPYFPSTYSLPSDSTTPATSSSNTTTTTTTSSSSSSSSNLTETPQRKNQNQNQNGHSSSSKSQSTSDPSPPSVNFNPAHMRAITPAITPSPRFDFDTRMLSPGHVHLQLLNLLAAGGHHLPGSSGEVVGDAGVYDPQQQQPQQIPYDFGIGMGMGGYGGYGGGGGGYGMVDAMMPPTAIPFNAKSSPLIQHPSSSTSSYPPPPPPSEGLISFDSSPGGVLYDPHVHSHNLERNWQAAEDIDKDVSVLSSRISNFIDTLGLGGASELNDDAKSVGSAAESVGAQEGAGGSKNTNSSNNNRPSTSSSNAMDASHADFDFESFLNTMPSTDPSIDYGDFASTAFLDEMPSTPVTTSSTADTTTTSPTTALRHVSPEVSITDSGGRKRKPDVAELENALADGGSAEASELHVGKSKRRKSK